MAVGTLESKTNIGGSRTERWTQTSASGAAQTCSTNAVEGRTLRAVTVKYSAALTGTITVTLNSGAGAGFDTLLQNISLTSATDGVYIPAQPLPLLAGDAIDVVAPALAAQTSAVAIYTEAR